MSIDAECSACRLSEVVHDRPKQVVAPLALSRYQDSPPTASGGSAASRGRARSPDAGEAAHRQIRGRRASPGDRPARHPAPRDIGERRLRRDRGVPGRHGSGLPGARRQDRHGVSTSDFSEQPILDLLDILLLVFIVVELLFAVRSTVEKRELLAEPFLLVGIIASIKEIVVLSVEAAKEVGNGARVRRPHHRDRRARRPGAAAGRDLVPAPAQGAGARRGDQRTAGARASGGLTG